MSLDGEAVWALPGPRRFLRAVHSDLRRGASVLLVCPNDRWPPDLLEAIEGTRPPNVDVQRIDSAVIGSDRQIEDALYEYLGLRRTTPGERLSPASLALHASIGRRLILIDIRSMDERARTRWLRFQSDYSRAVQELPPAQRSVFVGACLPTAGIDLSPASEPALTRRWWWGAVDTTDSTSFVIERSTESGRALEPVDVSMIVEVSRFDLELAGALVDAWRSDWERTTHEVIGQARPATVTAGDVARLTSVLDRPPEQLVQAWMMGSVEAWRPHGLSLHISAALVEDPDELHRRIWMAQVKTLFPLIEIHRAQLAASIAGQRHRVDKAWRETDLEGLEIGPLVKVVTSSPRIRLREAERELMHWLHHTRNALAHLDPVPSAALSRGRRLLESSRRENASD